MAKCYMVFEIEAEGLPDADEIATISAAFGVTIAGVYPEFNTEIDNDGQVIIYTGHIAESFGV